MPRPIFFAARSGRFTTTASTKIIDNKTNGDLVYRFHNTSKSDALTILVLNKAGNSSTHTVAVRGSIDLLVPKDGSGSVTGTGVYDLLRNSATVRSGSFSDDVQIAALGGQDYLYRIINSSIETGNNVKVYVNTAEVAELLPECSIDVVLSGNVTVEKSDPMSDFKIEGVFDLVAEMKP